MWTVPNLITMLRIILLPFFLWQVSRNNFGWAVIIFFIAGVSDGIDGWLARKLNQHSRFGQMLDPLADKLLLVSTFLVLTIPGRGYEPLPIWLTASVILRDILILASALTIQFVTGFNRFRPSYYGKLSTTVQMGLIIVFIVMHAIVPRVAWLGFGGTGAGLGRPLQVFMTVCYIITLFVTVFSGLHYIVHVKRLMAESKKEEQV